MSHLGHNRVWEDAPGCGRMRQVVGGCARCNRVQLSRGGGGRSATLQKVFTLLTWSAMGCSRVQRGGVGSGRLVISNSGFPRAYLGCGGVQNVGICALATGIVLINPGELC